MKSGKVNYKSGIAATQVRFFGDVALMSGKAAIEVDIGGQPKSLRLLFLNAWTRTPQGWKFVAWQSCPSRRVTAFKGRREDDRLLTGRGRYTADWNLPGQLYGYFLRSDRAHAEILSLKIPEHFPGVKAILTGEDTADLKTPPPMVSYPGQGGRASRCRTATCSRASACASSARRSRWWSRPRRRRRRTPPRRSRSSTATCRRWWTPTPRSSPARRSCTTRSRAISPSTTTTATRRPPQAAFARAAHVTRVTLDSTRVSGTPMEPKACVAAYDAQDRSFDVYASSQGLSMMLPNFVAIIGVPAEKIRVHAHDVGGGFGIRSQAYPEYCALMLAARKLGRPVKWVGSRFETIVSDHHGRAAQLAGELALDRDGRFIGLRFAGCATSARTCRSPGR